MIRDVSIKCHLSVNNCDAIFIGLPMRGSHNICGVHPIVLTNEHPSVVCCLFRCVETSPM